MSKLSLSCYSLSSLFLILPSVVMRNIYLLVLHSSLLGKCYHILPWSSLPYTKQSLSSSHRPSFLDLWLFTPSTPLAWHVSLLRHRSWPTLSLRRAACLCDATGRIWTISHFLLTVSLHIPQNIVLSALCCEPEPCPSTILPLCPAVG